MDVLFKCKDSVNFMLIFLKLIVNSTSIDKIRQGGSLLINKWGFLYGFFTKKRCIF